MNNLSQAIRKFNRFELKYLVPVQKAAEFHYDLLAYLVPDEHGNTEGSYPLASLYYDSPDLRFYWEKIDGIKFRRKLRIRRYDADIPLEQDTPVYVEIKQRLNRVTQKRRVRLPYRDALRLCNDREIPEHEPQDSAVIQEIASMVWQYNLRATSLINYQRKALVGTDYDIGLRVTFDTALTYRTSSLHFHEKQDNLFLFPPDWTIVEIKVNERIPYWLTEIVASHNLQLIRISKYCRSIELAQNLMTVGGIHGFS